MNPRILRFSIRDTTYELSLPESYRKIIAAGVAWFFLFLIAIFSFGGGDRVEALESAQPTGPKRYVREQITWAVASDGQILFEKIDVVKRPTPIGMIQSVLRSGSTGYGVLVSTRSEEVLLDLWASDLKPEEIENLTLVGNSSRDGREFFLSVGGEDPFAVVKIKKRDGFWMLYGVSPLRDESLGIYGLSKSSRP